MRNASAASADSPPNGVAAFRTTGFCTTGFCAIGCWTTGCCPAAIATGEDDGGAAAGATPPPSGNTSPHPRQRTRRPAMWSAAR
jgi:hypothetical protein